MVRAMWRSMPSPTRIGLVLAGSGVFADFVHHVFTHNQHAFEGLQIDLIGHVLTLAGMLIALSGVIHAAVDSRRRTKQKGGSDAARSCASATR
jgi:hypothetical protein